MEYYIWDEAGHVLAYDGDDPAPTDWIPISLTEYNRRLAEEQ